MPRGKDSIVGPEVADQTRLRPIVPLRSIDEFVAFLADVEDLFGPRKRPRTSTTGKRFEL
jgi:hypothetical protein